jgi:peptide/nickel transport system permease protein
MPHLVYALRRLAQAVPLVLVIIGINFVLIHAAPGDPVDVLLGPTEADPQVVAQLRQELGLDRPLPVQLWNYYAKVLSLDLGTSFRYREPVAELIASRLPATLLLMGTALVVSTLVALTLGILAALRPYSLLDNTATFVALAGFSMPVFWLGQVMLLVFALQLDWFPAQGMLSLRAPSEGWGRVLDIGYHLVLPAVTYSIYHLALLYRLTRAKMQEVLAQDFIVTARAKGVPELRVVLRHALRNALLPLVTVIGINFGFMLAGSVLTETVFAWPGTGRLLYEAILARDYPLLMGLFTCLSTMVVAVNVATDILYALIDPRVVYR